MGVRASALRPAPAAGPCPWPKRQLALAEPKLAPLPLQTRGSQSFLAGVPRLVLGERDDQVRAGMSPAGAAWLARQAERQGAGLSTRSAHAPAPSSCLPHQRLLATGVPCRRTAASSLWPAASSLPVATHRTPRPVPRCVRQGVIHGIHPVATAELPRTSARAGVPFSPNQALQFGCEALSWMRREAAARPGQHLRFSHAGGNTGSAAISCAVLPHGQLPQRLIRCLETCGLTV